MSLAKFQTVMGRRIPLMFPNNEPRSDVRLLYLDMNGLVIVFTSGEWACVRIDRDGPEHGWRPGDFVPLGFLSEAEAVAAEEALTAKYTAERDEWEHKEYERLRRKFGTA